jgi:hypothetical protein
MKHECVRKIYICVLTISNFKYGIIEKKSCVVARYLSKMEIVS